jgi:hypothetical protein
MTPTFSFEKMIDATGYSVNCCDSDNQAALTQQLFILSKLTWVQIKGSGRHKLGAELISQNSIRVALPAAVTPDLALLAFRYNGMRPMIGYREGRVYHILLLDHNFSCYQH